jgi:hypothetical protein
MLLELVDTCFLPSIYTLIRISWHVEGPQHFEIADHPIWVNNNPILCE